jgi:hypothetical protein
LVAVEVVLSLIERFVVWAVNLDNQPLAQAKEVRLVPHNGACRRK